MVCLLSLFTGLYGEPCMELADMVSREFPVLASLNPAKAICDMFYSLYYYDGLEVFAGNVALIGLFSAALFAVGVPVREEAALCKPVDMPWNVVAKHPIYLLVYVGLFRASWACLITSRRVPAGRQVRAMSRPRCPSR